LQGVGLRTGDLGAQLQILSEQQDVGDEQEQQHAPERDGGQLLP